jgi:hypothetical protein
MADPVVWVRLESALDPSLAMSVAETTLLYVS